MGVVHWKPLANENWQVQEVFSMEDLQDHCLSQGTQIGILVTKGGGHAPAIEVAFADYQGRMCGCPAEIFSARTKNHLANVSI